MFNELRPILLFAAWSIMFAHSIVPHAHEGSQELEIWENNHDHDESLLDVLSHIFHFSTGEDHFEDYSTTFDYRFLATLFSGSRTLQIETETHSSKANAIKCISHAPPLIRGLRAPPFCL